MDRLIQFLATMLIKLRSRIRQEPAGVREADDYMLFLKRAADRGGSNLSFTRKLSRTEFNNRESNAPYWDYIQSGDYHYFVSRFLFLNHITQYSFFSAHQCVENYLKAYLKMRGKDVSMRHDLPEILRNCRKVAPVRHLFIHSTQAEVAAYRYDPFFELARYPVQHVVPEGEGYVIMYPYDLRVLDYFVFRMRELMTVPSNTRDIFRNGHFYLNTCKEDSPWAYNYLSLGNINFGNKFD